MRAVLCRAYGDYRQMRVEEVATPEPGPGDVLIDVASSGVSFANLLAISGQHQNRSTLPFIAGTEVAGTVRVCGSAVSHVHPGERVVAAVRNGGFAEAVSVPAATVYPIPDVLPFQEAVVFSTIYATAYASLVWYAHLCPGEVLLVHGAGGATGLAAVEIGRALGARVIATASTEEKRRMAKDRGADVVIDSSRGGFRDEVLALTGGRGADIIFDPVGGSVFLESLRCVAPEGRLLPVGFASGDIPQIPANIVLVKNIAVLGVYWGYHLGWAKTVPKAGNTERVRSLFVALFRMYTEGLLRPLVQCHLPLSDFANALDILQSRQAIGKVVLDCDLDSHAGRFG